MNLVSIDSEKKDK